MKKTNAIVVIGSVAIDSVETPFGKRDNVLGGSATYFSLSARFFGRVHVVATVGKDFPKKYLTVLKKKGIGTDGIVVGEGDTFKWKGKYGADLNTVDTIYTHLNVFKDFKPVIPSHLRRARTLFLANIDPVLQDDVLSQARHPALVACDTMNFWITHKRKELLRVLKKVDLILLNDSEAKLLSEDSNLFKAARWILSKGPRMAVIKKGEHGVFFTSGNSSFLAPAYPLESLRDPTGAGDSFGGGMIGYLSKARKVNEATIRKAIIYGSAIGSFCVEDFSVARLLRLSRRDIESRFKAFRKCTRF